MAATFREPHNLGKLLKNSLVQCNLNFCMQKKGQQLQGTPSRVMRAPRKDLVDFVSLTERSRAMWLMARLHLLPFDLRTDHRRWRLTATRKTIRCRGLSQKAQKQARYYYYTGKCYFWPILQKEILWVGCISQGGGGTWTLTRKVASDFFSYFTAFLSAMGYLIKIFQFSWASSCQKSKDSKDTS